MIYGPYSSAARAKAAGQAQAAPVRAPAASPRTEGATRPTPVRDSSFADVLRREALTTLTPAPLRFSKHAEERMRERGIELDPEALDRLESAVEKAGGKGSRESVVLMDENAFIVSVAPRTVVTVMELANMRESVVTNIDSFVWAGP